MGGRRGRRRRRRRLVWENMREEGGG